MVFCLNIERIRLALQSVTGTNLFNPEVYYLEHLPAKLEWSEVGQVIAMALVLSAARHAVSVLAGRAHRSGGGAAP